mgnify:CR=1 FL=1
MEEVLSRVYFRMSSNRGMLYKDIVKLLLLTYRTASMLKR